MRTRVAGEGVEGVGVVALLGVVGAGMLWLMLLTAC